LIAEHDEARHLRVLQKRLAAELTAMVHSEEDLQNAIKASSILFGQSTSEDLKGLDEQTFLDVFDGVPQAEVPASVIADGMDIVAALATDTGFLKSNGEARRALKENSISVNKEKVTEDYQLSNTDLINNKFVLLQRGKKNYFVLSIV
jgi:tyrosyl-tRNA synthetase